MAYITVVRTWLILSYMAYTNMAYITLYGIYMYCLTWHILPYMAFITVHGIYYLIWHILPYMHMAYITL